MEKKMNKDLISIIVPVYNTEKYLDNCIKSIVNQSYKNLEIILIDDGSTDNSGEICEKWSKKDSRIVLIHQNNQGVSTARNIGLNIATGEYIGFVDSDDYIDEKMYELLINKIKKYDAGICFCNVYAVNDNIINAPQMSYPEICTSKEFMNIYWKTKNKNGVLWNKLIKSKYFKNIKFESNISYAEDVLVYFQILNRAEKVVFEKSYLYFHRNRKDSLSYRLDIKRYPDNLEVMSNLNKILEHNEIENRFYVQAEFVRNLMNYEYEAKSKNVNLNFSKYKKIANQYLEEGLLKKNIGLKRRASVIFALYFKKIYFKYREYKRNKNVMKDDAND
jgi:glycosyltransferase involved in cell wall biosynthesis